MRPLELWGGVECTVNRVGDAYFDQMERSGHAWRAADIDLFADLGVRALRYPVLWERTAPDAGKQIDWRWPDERLARLRERGIRPIVGLVHHGSGPAHTSLMDEGFAQGLACYARHVAERYPWVTDWTPVNEPLTTARFSGLYGHWYPHAADRRLFVRALLNQLRGVVLAMREIRAVNGAARLVQTEDLGRPFGTGPLRAQVKHERERRWLTWDLLSGAVDRSHPMHRFLLGAGASDAELAFFAERAEPPDVIGVNYYVTSDRWLDHRLDLYPHTRQARYVDVEAVRARPRGIAGHERLLFEAWLRYRKPTALTEAHLGCTREEQVRWLVDAWNGAQRARARGAYVHAVTVWALLGSFDWNSLVTRQDGPYEAGPFDVRAREPRRTALFAAARSLASGRSPAHPVLGEPGWWHRPARLTVGSRPGARDGHRAPEAPPVLIAGGQGTLGRAFLRICAARGLAARAVGRAEMNVWDPASVEAVLGHVRPWAVVNAAGYVQVDAAETEADACWKGNVAGPVNLAAACRRHQIPFVTFSSDLVFDGAQQRPYHESSRPAPLNVYGAAKAEAERRVLDLLPTALMVRTSAFFGPWDEANFAACVSSAVGRGTPFLAARDCVVSPTYVPDLVHAVLDLLVDGERGVWHLANEGEVTWHEFGRMVTREAGAGEELVQPCSWRSVWRPARRPPYSALGSERASIMRPLAAAVRSFVEERNVLAAQGREHARPSTARPNEGR